LHCSTEKKRHLSMRCDTPGIRQGHSAEVADSPLAVDDQIVAIYAQKLAGIVRGRRCIIDIGKRLSTQPLQPANASPCEVGSLAVCAMQHLD